jgi:4-amino-4-deoxy-L-arabinose transferase-like glycosyltransferase
VAALVGLGFVLRLALAIALGLNEPPARSSDDREYDRYAWNLAQGRGYRGQSPDVADQDHLTAYRVPGTSLVWAALYAALGHRYDAVRVLNCLAGAAAVWLTYAIGRRCYGERVGLATAALYAVYPTALIFNVGLVSEPLGTLWFLLSLLLSLHFAERPSWGRATAAGLLLGAASLTRPNSLFMIPLIGAWALIQFRGRRRAALQALAIPVVALATFVPWVVRNYLVFERFIPVATSGGSGLLQGNNRIVATDPGLYGYNLWDTQIPEYRDALRAAGNEYERDQLAQRLALRWLAENPDRWGYLLGAKFVRSWTPILAARSPRLYRILYLVTWTPVLVLLAAAYFPTLVVALRRGEPTWLIHLAILHYVIVSEIFYASIRYRQSIEPLCLLLAVEAAACILPGLASRGARPTAEPGSAGRASEEQMVGQGAGQPVKS